MTIRRSLALIVATAAVLAAAACASNPTAPKGCDVISNTGNTSC